MGMRNEKAHPKGSASSVSWPYLDLTPPKNGLPVTGSSSCVKRARSTIALGANDRALLAQSKSASACASACRETPRHKHRLRADVLCGLTSRGAVLSG